MIQARLELGASSDGCARRTNTVAVTSSRELLDIVGHNRVGAGRDRLNPRIQGLWVVAGRELGLNIKPGWGGLNVVADDKIDVEVTLEVLGRGVRYFGKFPLASEQGMRILPSTFMTHNAV